MNKGTKISILGAGNVGASIAYTLTIQGLASEIVLIDINREKAKGEAMDIIQGTAFSAPVNIHDGDYPDAAGSNIVIVTAGVGRKPGQTRLELSRQNVNTVKEMIPQAVKYAPNAVYVVVSNPVDIITYVITKLSGLPRNQIVGTGTILDSARLRSLVADQVNLPAKNCHAYVLGEHGDSSVIAWSLATICGMNVKDYIAHMREKGADLQQVENEMRAAGAEIIKRKGATYYAVSMSVCRICECIVRDTGSILTISSLMSGQYGIDDICISLPYVIGSQGIKKCIYPPLLEEEEAQLRKSAECLRGMIDECDFAFLK